MAELTNIDTTFVLDPNIFLPWLQRNLEMAGVKFKRMNLDSLSDARHSGHDVLINATGLGPKNLADVKDENMELLKGQTMIIKSDYQKCLMRDDGKNYTYVIPRLDGNVILGGIRDLDVTYVKSFAFMVLLLTELVYSNTAVDIEVDKDVR